MVQPSPRASISAVIHYPANQRVITSICDLEATYSTFAEQLVLDLHNRCKLLPLLRAIHPDKLTAYKLLFGGGRSIIVKPAWNDPIVDGCLDVNVFLRYREGGESFMDTPDISILKTIPARYIRRESHRQTLKMDMLFYRIAKCNNPIISPYLRADDKTKLITLKGDTDGRGCASAAMKDWDADDEDCTLPSVWVCEFETTDEEKAIRKGYLEERDMADLNDDCAEVLSNDAPQDEGKGTANGKKITSKYTNVSADATNNASNAVSNAVNTNDHAENSDHADVTAAKSNNDDGSNTSSSSSGSGSSSDESSSDDSDSDVANEVQEPSCKEIEENSIKDKDDSLEKGKLAWDLKTFPASARSSGPLTKCKEMCGLWPSSNSSSSSSGSSSSSSGESSSDDSDSDVANEVEGSSSKKIEENSPQDKEELWELKEILTPADLSTSNRKPKLCNSDHCSLLACCAWASNLDPKSYCYVCLDCQRANFGGFPLVEELPVRCLSRENREAILNKCTKFQEVSFT